MATQGIVSFSFDPLSGNTVTDVWCQDLNNLNPSAQTPELLVRTVARSDANNQVPIAGYQAAVDTWVSNGFSVAAVLPPEFDGAAANGLCPNDVLGFQGNPLLNAYINDFSFRAENFAANLAPHGLNTYWVWNEPNINGRISSGSNCPPGSTAVPTALAPANFAAMLYQGCTRIKAGGGPGTKVYAGALSMLYPGKPLNNGHFDLYMDAVYAYLTGHGVRAPFPWDALSLNMEGLWPASSHYAAQVKQALQAVQRKYHDTSPIIVSEWGVKARYATQVSPNATDTYNDLRTSFATMYFFEHGTDPDGYGATTWGAPNQQITPTGQTPWYSVLQSLYQTW
ncbi:MAG: hypothetical protein NVSMB65_07530 [Chloroflexota bacterium]